METYGISLSCLLMFWSPALRTKNVSVKFGCVFSSSPHQTLTPQLSNIVVVVGLIDNLYILFYICCIPQIIKNIKYTMLVNYNLTPH